MKAARTKTEPINDRPFAPPDWPALARENRKVAVLKPHPRNPHVHPEEQISAMAAGIKEFGIYKVSVLVDEKDTILAGHGMILACKRAGVEEIPVAVARGWSEEKKLAVVEADNRFAELSAWNEQLRIENLQQLQAWGFPLELTGWAAEPLADFLHKGTVYPKDPEEAPPVPHKPVSRRGDVWVLGTLHRLLCGDATSESDVAKCLAGKKPHLMVTDPPYGVEYNAGWRNDAAQAGYTSMGRGPPGGRAVGKVENDNRADWREAWALFPGAVVYVWHAPTKVGVVAQSLEATKFVIRAQIIWGKNNIVVSRGDYHPQHESLFYAVRKGATGHWAGDRKQTTLWNIDKPMKSETGHSTQKPIECMKRPIENNSCSGDAVYDPFVGSGTTIIACEMTRRRALAIEVEPGYVDVAVQRWQEFTGKKAVLEATGRTFDQTRAERALPKKRAPAGKSGPARAKGKGSATPPASPPGEPGRSPSASRG